MAAAALLASPDDVLLVLPADHHIADVAAFRVAVDRAVEVASSGRLVAFGVVPGRLETGFGYIVPGSSNGESQSEVRPIDRFVEKPDAAMAADLIESGALWNSGMFVFPVALLIEELSRHAPEILTRVEEAHRSAVGHTDIGRIELGPEFAMAPDLSIDVAVMEPTDRGAVVSLDAGWNDVGSWESLWELSEQDFAGNVSSGEVVAIESSDNYLRSEGPLIAVIGVEGLVVVATDDAVLWYPAIAPRTSRASSRWFPPKSSSAEVWPASADQTKFLEKDPGQLTCRDQSSSGRHKGVAPAYRQQIGQRSSFDGGVGRPVVRLDDGLASAHHDVLIDAAGSRSATIAAVGPRSHRLSWPRPTASIALPDQWRPLGPAAPFHQWPIHQWVVRWPFLHRTNGGRRR